MNKNSENTKLQKLISELDVFRQKLWKIDYIHNKYEFLQTMKDLRKYLSSCDDDKVTDLFLHSKFYIENVDFFVSMNQYFIRAMEADEALGILSKNQGDKRVIECMDVDYIIEDYQRKWNDIKDLDIKWDETLVMVWCGPMPETMLYIYENTPIKKVIWVDYNYEAIYIAWEMVRALGLTDIQLTYADGCDFDYSDVDIVYIPSFVEVKSEVMDQIVKTWKKDVQVLVRDIEWMNQLVYRWLSKDINPELKVSSVSTSAWTYHKTKMIKFTRYNI